MEESKEKPMSKDALTELLDNLATESAMSGSDVLAAKFREFAQKERDKNEVP